MAPHVIDLISSSPPRRNKHRRPLSPQFFVSSDLAITGNDSLGQDTRSTKRLRISTSPPQLAANPSRTTEPPFLNTAPNRPNQLEFDPIEFTSSFDPDAPVIQQNTPRHNSSSVAQPHPTNQTSKAPFQISLSSDPFASSPLPALATTPKEQSKKCIASILDSDPFASSPPPLPPPGEQHKSKEQPKPVYPCSNIDDLSDPFASSQEGNLFNSSKTSTPRRAVSVEVVDHSRRRKHWDPISSSAPEQTPRVSPPKKAAAKTRTIETVTISSGSDSAGTSEDEFPDFANFDASRVRPRPRPPIRRSHSEILSSRSSRPKPATTATTRAAAKSSEQRARDKDVQAAAKAAEKERKRLEREHTIEARALEKERAAALAEVNKVRTDKKVSTPEMILVMPSSINEGLKMQLETLLDGLSVEYTPWDSPVPSAFKWKRKVRSRFDEELGRWEPTAPHIEPENHALVLLAADEFVSMAVSDAVESSVSQTKRHFPGHKIIYILEGITPWMKKNRNIRNRRFASGVRAQDQAASEAAAASSRRRRNNAATEEYISEDIIEDAMMRLQVEHDVLIHHTAALPETAQWIVAFTQHISTIPYKKMRDKMTSTAAFCMESGQVRTGDDTRDTYVRMLQEIARVTAPIAYGIVSEFDTVSSLVRGLEQGGPLRLESVRKSANKDGAASDRTVGQAVSRRIHRVFTGRDETSTDV